MVINTVGVEVSDTRYVTKAGAYLFKIEKFEEDGFTQYGDAKFKLQMKGVERGTKTPLYMHYESFNVGTKSLWRIKMLEVGLKAPEIYDINDFIGRWVVGNIAAKNYTKKDGTPGTSYEVTSWDYSTLNDKMPPIPEAKEESNDGVGESVPVEVDGVEIDTDSIPF